MGWFRRKKKKFRRYYRKTKRTAYKYGKRGLGLSAGGRGAHNPENPILGIPSFRDAYRSDRRRQRYSKPAAKRKPKSRGRRYSSQTRRYRRSTRPRGKYYYSRRRRYRRRY